MTPRDKLSKREKDIRAGDGGLTVAWKPSLAR